jgi:hypothetical protein
MRFIKLTAFLFASLLLTNCTDVKTDEEKRITIETILEEYNDCKANAESNHDCKSFVARAICEYNGLDDLKKDGAYIEYNEIYEFITGGNSWKSLGFAPDQKVLSEAQKLVNEGYAVIAINTEDKHKFTVLIVKGEEVKSSKWGVNVPTCAAFFPASSNLESFINKTINYAWSKPDGVEFFVKR